MKLVRCRNQACEEPCGQRGLHEPGHWCEDFGCGADCRPVRARRMWQVYGPDGKPIGRPALNRRRVQNEGCTPWRILYREGWRCRPVTVIEEDRPC